MPLIAAGGADGEFIGAAMKDLIATSATKGAVSDAQVKSALKASQREDGGRRQAADR